MSKSFEQQVDELNKEWQENPRWNGVVRDYSAEEVISLRGSVDVLQRALSGAMARLSVERGARRA